MKRILVLAVAVSLGFAVSTAYGAEKRAVQVVKPQQIEKQHMMQISKDKYTVKLYCKAGNMSAGPQGPGGYETNDPVTGQLRVFEIDTATCSGNSCQPKKNGYFKLVSCPSPPSATQALTVILPANKVYWMAGYASNNPNMQRGAYIDTGLLKQDKTEDLFFMYPLSALGGDGLARFNQVMSWPMPSTVIIE
ncbi:MAG: hypothetical protein JXA24_01230 [Proteobacteria bacterium]|nr:hypothetical protein [Pseudomonadota bacterium]